MLSFRGSFAFVGLFSFFINLLMLVPPLYMLQMYDRVLVSRSQSTLLLLTMIVLVLFATLGALEFARNRIVTRIGTRLDQKLDARLFDAMFQLSLRNPSQTHGQALEDLQQIRQFMGSNGLFAFFDAPWIPIFIIVLFFFHPLYGWFGVTAAITLFILAVINEWTTKQSLSAASEAMIQSRSTVASETRNAEVVHAMGMGGALRNRWLQIHDRYLLSHGSASDRSSALSNLSKVIRIASQSLMLGLGGWLAIQFQVTSGMIIAGSIVLGRALAPLDLLIAGWKQFSSARTSYGRLQRLLAEVPADMPRMSLPEPRGALSVQQIVMLPPRGSKPVLRGVDFELAAGESLAVVGPSGAGKSSLARALLGIWPLAAGKVRLDGADIAQWDRNELGPFIGYLPQDIELFAGTVAENIARFGTVDPKAVVAAAEMADVHGRILELPNGYETQIGSGGAALSGGQRQRIGLARAVYGSPRLVVLDEPNSNLDEAGEQGLTAAVTRLKQLGVTVVLISHRPTILATVDKILVLSNGNKLGFGERAEMLAKIPGAALEHAAGGGAQKALPRRPRQIRLTPSVPVE